MSAESPLILI